MYIVYTYVCMCVCVRFCITYQIDIVSSHGLPSLSYIRHSE